MRVVAGATTKDVAEDYRHFDKVITAAHPLVLSLKTLKWYNLAPQKKVVPDDIEASARDRLMAESINGSLNELGELGFVILHRCGADFYFLLVCSWRNNNELWQSVYAKDGVGQATFERFQAGIDHRAAFCVWELGAVMHEKHAWRRFLLSERGKNDRLDYLNDKYSGTV